MPPTRDITLYHSPNTRSSATLTLLEEMGVPFRLEVINIRAGEGRTPEFRKINPMGKVPTITNGNAVVTEQVAIFLYLADLFPELGFAPAFDDPLRGPYLRWMIFYGTCFEPAGVDRAMKRDAGDPQMMPYGSYDATLKAIVDQIRPGPWLLGERFSAADVLWGAAFAWTTSFGIVPKLPEIEAYYTKVMSRPAAQKVRKMDADLTAEYAAAKG
jgi:glutathione S-transferase